MAWVNPISFTAPQAGQTPLGGAPSPARSDMLAMLLKGQQAPNYESVQSPLEGIAKALTSGLQGWEMSQAAEGSRAEKKALADAEDAKKQASAQSLADLLAPPVNPDGSPNPKNKQLAAMLAGGLVAPSTFGDEISTKLGFGKAANPFANAVKVGQTDTLLGPPGPDGKPTILYQGPGNAAEGAKPTLTEIVRNGQKVRVWSWPDGRTQDVGLSEMPATPARPLSPEERTRWGIAPDDPTIWGTEDDGRTIKPIAKSDMMSPGAFQQHVDLANAGKTTITNNVGEDGSRLPAPPPGQVYAMKPGPDGKPVVAMEVDPTGKFLRPRLIDIAGGKPEADATAAAKVKENQDKAKETTANFVLDSIDRAIPMIKARPAVTTGVLGALSQNIPGTPSFDVAQLLTTVKANIGFDKLAQMRASSPSGGALGQVSNFENKLLQSVFGNLEQGQSTEQLLHNLSLIRNGFADIQNTGELTKIGRLVDSGQITYEEGVRRAAPILEASRAPAADDPLGLRR